MTSPGATNELERCEREQAELIERAREEATAGNSVMCWLAALGWADWEIEKELIRAHESGPTFQR